MRKPITKIYTCECGWWAQKFTGRNCPECITGIPKVKDISDQIDFDNLREEREDR